MPKDVLVTGSDTDSRPSRLETPADACAALNLAWPVLVVEARQVLAG